MWYPFDSDDRPRLQRLTEAVMRGEDAFFTEHSLFAGRKGPVVMLNYRQEAPPNPISSLARGLVVERETGRILSMPFKRFANIGEGHALPVEIERCDVLEKLDGSMLGVYFMDGDPTRPVWHTRRMIAFADADVMSTGFDGDEAPLLRLVEPYLRAIRFTSEHARWTWTFEFLHKPRPVVTRYTRDQLGLHLIGVRDLDTLAEASEDRLDSLAAEIGARRPRRWPAMRDRAMILEWLSQFPDDYEGVVLRDPLTGHRVKLKSPRYLAYHRLLGSMSDRNLIPLWIAGEQSEILAYFPEAASRFHAIESRFIELRDTLVGRVASLIEGHTDRKSLALSMRAAVVPSFEQAVAFRSLGSTPNRLSATIEAILREQPPERLRELLDLGDG